MPDKPRYTSLADAIRANADDIAREIEEDMTAYSRRPGTTMPQPVPQSSSGVVPPSGVEFVPYDPATTGQVRWTRSDSPGVTSYRVTLDAVTIQDTDATSAEVSGLTVGTEHVFTVVAVTAGGDSDPVTVTFTPSTGATGGTAPSLTFTDNGTSPLPGTSWTYEWPGSGAGAAAYHSVWVTISRDAAHVDKIVSQHITDGSTALEVTGLPSDGSTIYEQLVIIPAKSDGTPDWSAVVTFERNRTAHTIDNSAPPATATGRNTTLHNGIGVVVDDAAFSRQTLNGGTMVIDGVQGGVALENFAITVGGSARIVIRLQNCRNAVIRNGWISAPHTSEFYHDGSVWDNVLFFIEPSCENITFENVNMAGAHHQILSYRAAGTHVKRCIFARPYRHCVLIYEDSGAGSRASLIEDCYGYGHPSDAMRDGGSVDLFNFISCVEPIAGRKHTARRILAERGNGEYGSGIIWDGNDNAGMHGGWLAEELWVLDTCNKAYGIAGGRNSTLRNSKAYQGSQSPARLKGDGGIPGYIYDHWNPSPTSYGHAKSRDFSNNRFENVEAYWYMQTSKYNGRRDFHPPVTSDNDYARGWPSSAAVFDNCNDNASLTRAGVRNEAAEALKAVPVYDMGGAAREMRLENWYETGAIAPDGTGSGTVDTGSGGGTGGSDDGTTDDGLDPVTGLQVEFVTATEVKVQWTAPADSTDLARYDIMLNGEVYRTRAANETANYLGGLSSGTTVEIGIIPVYSSASGPVEFITVTTL